MEVNSDNSSKNIQTLRARIFDFFSRVPLLGWLLGMLIAAVLEHFLGDLAADVLRLPKIPALFGVLIMLKKPMLIPSAILYGVLIYGLPIGVIGRLSAKPANWLAAKLFNFQIGFAVIVHLSLLYAALHIWADISAYRGLTLKLTLIAIMVTLSLNVINGYMGEFSCSHPGFMALGAYGASVVTVLLFVNDRLFGPALLPSALGPFVFPLALITGGIIAALGALVIAIPSFRTRGDYLAIISLAFMFSAFWAGVAGGLFAHVLRYVNPGTFGLQTLAEVLAMVYFGGLNSVYGSIVGAVSLSLLGEALRPLEIFKWIIIPLLLILVMIYRPTGLIAFKEFNVRNLIEPKEKV